MAARPPNVNGLLVAAVVLLLLVAFPPKLGIGLFAVAKLNGFGRVSTTCAGVVDVAGAIKLKLPSPDPPKLNTLLSVLGNVNGEGFGAVLELPPAPPNVNNGAAALPGAVVVPPVADFDAVSAGAAAAVAVPKLKTGVAAGVAAGAAVIADPNIGVPTDAAAADVSFVVAVLAPPKLNSFCGSAAAVGAGVAVVVGGLNALPKLGVLLNPPNSIGLGVQLFMLNVGAVVVAPLLLLLPVAAVGFPNENTFSAVVVDVIVTEVVTTLGVAVAVAAVAGLPKVNNGVPVEAVVVAAGAEVAAGVAAAAAAGAVVTVPKENIGAHAAVVVGSLVATAAGAAFDVALPNVNIGVADGVVVVGATAVVVAVEALLKVNGFAKVVVVVVVVLGVIVLVVFADIKDIFDVVGKVKLVKPPTTLFVVVDVAAKVVVVGVWLNDSNVGALFVVVVVVVSALVVVVVVAAVVVTLAVEIVGAVVVVVTAAAIVVLAVVGVVGFAGFATIDGTVAVAAAVTVVLAAVVVVFSFSVVSGSSASSPK